VIGVHSANARIAADMVGNIVAGAAV